MIAKKSVIVFLTSLFTVFGGTLIAQQGGMQIPQGMPMAPPTPEQIQAQMKQMVQMMFSQIDTDSSGSISLDEYKKMLEMMRPAQSSDGESEEETAERIKKEFEDADSDDDDALSLDEMVELAMKQMKADQREQMKREVQRMLPQFDGDKNGSISFDEYTKMYKTITAGMPMPSGGQETEEEETDRLKQEFEDGDSDDDDALSEDEMVELVFKLMDPTASDQE